MDAFKIQIVFYRKEILCVHVITFDMHTFWYAYIDKAW